jgi:hypothetical protein
MRNHPRRSRCHAGERRGAEKGLTHWIDDPDCYRSAMLAVFAALIRNAPEGDEEAIARAIEGLKGILLTRSIDNVR